MGMAILGSNFVGPPGKVTAVKTTGSLVGSALAKSGKAFEGAVGKLLESVGVVKNTQLDKVTLKSGKVVNTIADFKGGNVGIIEAKSGKVVDFKPQLEAQATVASQTGQPYTVVVSPATQRVSQNVVSAAEQTGGGVYRYDPLSGTITPWGH